jgi:hypothetical protein
MDREQLYLRVERTSYVIIVVSILLIILVGLSGCAPTPKPLSPEAQTAFYATRVVKVLDVVRDATIAANDLVPPIISTESTRKVVLWHKSAVQVIQTVPNGWKPTVKSTLYVLTCDPRAGTSLPCVPQLGATEVEHLRPYIGLLLVVIEEVK